MKALKKLPVKQVATKKLPAKKAVPGTGKPVKVAKVHEEPVTVKIGKHNVKIANLKKSAQGDAKYFTRHDPKDNPGRWRYLVRSAVRAGQLPEAEGETLVK